jgi:hypothetical protein
MLKVFREPHCFVCRTGHPKFFPMKGPVSQLLPRINFKRPQVELPTPEVLFIDGYAFDAGMLRQNVFLEDTVETRHIRGYKGY